MLSVSCACLFIIPYPSHEVKRGLCTEAAERLTAYQGELTAMELFTLVPVFIGLVFVLVVGAIIFAVVKGIGTWAWNNQQPVVTAAARVAAKRTETRGMGDDSPVRTSYYATFELTGGERREVGISGSEYGQLAEGDAGNLTMQGTRYQGFARSQV